MLQRQHQTVVFIKIYGIIVDFRCYEIFKIDILESKSKFDFSRDGMLRPTTVTTACHIALLFKYFLSDKIR